jgi:MerR family copper efflux transcriptional regulator
METLSIGQVAHRAGVGIDTIRFYERQGVLEKPSRRESGYRQYPEEVVKQIRFIQRAKLLGFSLKEIVGLLNLRVDGLTSCEQVKEAAYAKLDQVERKIAELEHMRQALLQVASLCTGKGPASACPMLDALDQQEQFEQLTDHKENI